jgi:hypothetical protein
MSVTHFADDDTLAYIANLEAEITRYKEAEKALPEGPPIDRRVRQELIVYIDALRAHAAALQAEREAMREDAERYRWLRENHNDSVNGRLCDPGAKPSSIDAAIDTARKETP